VQLSEFSVEGLFGRYDHSMRFPHGGERSDLPSVVILHGPNGVGKTTLLRMLDGIMHLDFDMFRVTPFGRARLRFSKEPELTVTRIGADGPLNIGFGSHEVLLHPKNKGAYQPAHEVAVEQFRSAFNEAVQPISFELIETQRAFRPPEDSASAEMAWRIRDPARAPGPSERLRLGYWTGRRNRDQPLAERVKQFTAEAQVDAARFFRGRDPSLFERILTALQKDELPEYSPQALLKSLRRIKREDATSARLGLTPDPWSEKQLTGVLKSLDDSPRGRQALLVLGSYVESLEARAALRRLVVDRLVTFERIMNEFLMDKSVSVGQDGLRMVADDGTALTERQLSSGEFHLLYLMVSALVAQRRGTVIAIDEPEMSMHIAWQRKLIRNLIECASNAVPQFVFATHSPDIVAEWREYMTKLGPTDVD
jgi:energy-coupling factor transporter ATP-binding protein EcfA2